MAWRGKNRAIGEEPDEGGPSGAGKPEIAAGHGLQRRTSGALTRRPATGEPLPSGGHLPLRQGPLRADWWDRLPDSVAARMEELAGEPIEWWARQSSQARVGRSSPRERPRAVLIGDIGVCFAEPRIDSQQRPVYTIDCYRLDPGSHRRAEVDSRPAKSDGSDRGRPSGSPPERGRERGRALGSDRDRSLGQSPDRDRGQDRDRRLGQNRGLGQDRDADRGQDRDRDDANGSLTPTAAVNRPALLGIGPPLRSVPGLDDATLKVLSSLPVRAQKLVTAPFDVQHPVLRQQSYYEGNDTQLSFFGLLLIGAKQITLAHGTRVIPAGHTEQTGHWSLTCRRAAVLGQISE